MSRKVLKLAGRRPMLLALIMATLTLGLLFSGWLTPTPSKAQTGGGNPQPNVENPCVEHGPYYGAWQADSCPSLNNSPGVSPSSYSCVKDSDPLPMPTVTPPTYSAGTKEQPITYDCPCPQGHTCPTANYGSISYTVQSVHWDPDLGTIEGIPGTHTATAWVNVVSSDPSFCGGDPGRVDIGTCTWTIIDTTPNSISVSIDFGPFLRGMEAILKEIPAGWSFNDPSVIFDKEITTTPICCGDGSVGAEIERSGSLSATVSGTAATPSYPLPITLGIVQVQLTASGTISLDAKVNSKSTSCPNDPPGHYCLVPSVTFTAAGSISLSVFSSSLLSVTGTISGGGAWSGSWCWYNLDDSEDFNDETPYSLCYNDIKLTGSYTLLSGATAAISITMVTGNCP